MQTFDPAQDSLADFAQFVPTQRRFGRPFHYYPSIDSSNAQALKLGHEGAPEGSLVLAEFQSAGRGRLGRAWQAKPSQSLLFSLVLRPAAETVFSALPLLFGVALCRAIRAYSKLNAQIKWPNDVWVQGRKLCGILMEVQTSQAKPDFVVLGVGLNIHQAKEDFPEELRRSASSLFLESGQHVSRRELLLAVLAEAEDLYQRFARQGFGPLAAEWESYSCLQRCQVRVQGVGRQWEGKVLGVTPEGALRLQLPSGREEQVMAGDVSLLRPMEGDAKP